MVCSSQRNTGGPVRPAAARGARQGNPSSCSPCDPGAPWACARTFHGTWSTRGELREDAGSSRVGRARPQSPQTSPGLADGQRHKHQTLLTGPSRRRGADIAGGSAAFRSERRAPRPPQGSGWVGDARHVGCGAGAGPASRPGPRPAPRCCLCLEVCTLKGNTWFFNNNKL